MKKRIYGGAVAIFARTLGNQQKMPLLQKKMIVRGADVNPSFDKLLLVDGQRAPESLVFAETVKQGFPCVFRGHVLDNKNRGGNVGRELADQSIQCFQASSGCSDHDDVAAFSHLTGC